MTLDLTDTASTVLTQQLQTSSLEPDRWSVQKKANGTVSLTDLNRPCLLD